MKKKRIIIIGAGGFISTEIEKELKNKFSVIPVLRKKINFLNVQSAKKLVQLLRPNDTIIFIASKAPVKNNKMFIDNMLMATNFIKLYSHFNFKQFIYISSDAVYSDKKIIKENSQTLPNSLHGLMHLMRERLFTQFLKIPVTILRITLVYGENDPHNSYGPNSFFRLAKNRKIISLYGKGEEKRDHIHVLDVAKFIRIVVEKNKKGIINVATGFVYSFNQIAKIIIKITNKKKTKIKLVKRKFPMPHLGYRSFNIKKLRQMNFKPSKFPQVAKLIFEKY